MRTFTFVEGGVAYVGGGETVEGDDGAAIQETEDSLKRLQDRRQSVTKNVNRPAERKKSLVNFQTDQELPN